MKTKLNDGTLVTITPPRRSPNDQQVLTQAVENNRHASLTREIEFTLDRESKKQFNAMARAIAEEFKLPLDRAKAALVETAFNCKYGDGQPAFKCIAEYSEGDEKRFRLGFLHGALVYFHNEKRKRVSLKESAAIFARMEEMDLADGSHDMAARAKWLRMVAAAIR